MITRYVLPLVSLLPSILMGEPNKSLEPIEFFRQRAEGDSTRTLHVALVRIEQTADGLQGVLSVLETRRHRSGVTGTSPSLHAGVLLESRNGDQYRVTLIRRSEGGGDGIAIQRLLGVESRSFDITFDDDGKLDPLGRRSRQIVSIAEASDEEAIVPNP